MNYSSRDPIELIHIRHTPKPSQAREILLGLSIENHCLWILVSPFETMPKSKRQSVVNLTKTAKKATKESKENLIEQVRWLSLYAEVGRSTLLLTLASVPLSPHAVQRFKSRPICWTMLGCLSSNSRGPNGFKK